jgi:hypothetical protein
MFGRNKFGYYIRLIFFGEIYLAKFIWRNLFGEIYLANNLDKLFGDYFCLLAEINVVNSLAKYF